MKALVKRYAQSGLWLEDMPVPGIGANDVLVKVLKTGICGTDVHIFSWDTWAQKTLELPLIPGHEFVGRIANLGQNVTAHHVGDLVSAEGHIVCGHCRNCLAGRRHLCAYTVGIGVNRDGAFAEYLAVPASNLWPCGADLSLEHLSVLDPLGNAAHTALSFDLIGEDVLITGAGPIGLMAAIMARHVGARHIVITEVNEYRLALAHKLAVSAVVDGRDDLKAVMKHLGMTEGFDVGFEMSGHAQPLTSMIDAMAHGGKIAMLGIQAGPTAVDWNAIVFKGLTLKGIYGRQMFETWYKVIAMLQSGMDIAPIMTHSFDYRDFEKGFEVMGSGNSGKVLLDWTTIDEH